MKDLSTTGKIIIAHVQNIPLTPDLNEAKKMKLRGKNRSNVTDFYCSLGTFFIQFNLNTLSLVSIMNEALCKSPFGSAALVQRDHNELIWSGSHLVFQSVLIMMPAGT